MKEYHIRAFARGLHTLEVLSLHNGLTISEIGRMIKLPQPTVFRLLKTLQQSGYVTHNRLNKTFHVTSNIRRLAAGAQIEPWIRDIAGPIADRLCTEIVWPVFIARLERARSQIIWSTSSRSPVAKNRYSAGLTFPALQSASGLMLVSLLDREARDQLILACEESDPGSLKPFRSRRSLLAYLARIGKAKVHFYAPKQSDRSWLTVPIFDGAHAFAALTVEFHDVDYSDEKLRALYLPTMRAAASDISSRLTSRNQQAMHGH
jgi:DNA-binding IclR family transcriptional regulator